MITNGAPEPLKTQLQLLGSCLSYQDFRQKVDDFLAAQEEWETPGTSTTAGKSAEASTTGTEMDVCELLKGKGKGKAKSKWKGKRSAASKVRGFPNMRPGDCFQCGRQGHRAADCPGEAADEDESENDEQLTGYEYMWCHICRGWGHRQRECPTRMRFGAAVYSVDEKAGTEDGGNEMEDLVEWTGDQRTEMTGRDSSGQRTQKTDRWAELEDRLDRFGLTTEEMDEWDALAEERVLQDWTGSRIQS